MSNIYKSNWFQPPMHFSRLENEKEMMTFPTSVKYMHAKRNFKI